MVSIHWAEWNYICHLRLKLWENLFFFIYNYETFIIRLQEANGYSILIVLGAVVKGSIKVERKGDVDQYFSNKEENEDRDNGEKDFNIPKIKTPQGINISRTYYEKSFVIRHVFILL